MIVIMRVGGPGEDVERVQQFLAERGLPSHAFFGAERVVLTVLGNPDPAELEPELITLPGVERIAPLRAPYKLASRESHPDSSVVRTVVGDIGARPFMVLAVLRDDSGDSGELAEAAGAIEAAGATPLLSGSGSEGDDAMPVVVEPSGPSDLRDLPASAALLWLRSHHMLNERLLRATAAAERPVILERGLSARVEEWLMAAESVLRAGNRRVVLCEGGIRTFEADRASTLDISAVPVLKHLSHLPVIVDPGSGATTAREVRSMALSAAAAGADGVLLEIGTHGEAHLAGRSFPLPLDHLPELMEALAKVAGAVGRPLPTVAAR